MKKTTRKSAMAGLCPLLKGKLNYSYFKKTQCLIVFSLFLSPLFAQEFVKPLFIDTKVPDSSLGYIINYKTTSARISDFKGKLVIFDFWFTTCPSCIRSFPETLRLQKEFSNQVQFIMVAHETSQEVSAFIHRWEQQHKTKFTLPIIVADTLLHQMLPHWCETHYAWVSPKGILVAQSSFTFMSKTIIRNYLEQAARYNQ